jgi:hypothetical protein
MNKEIETINISVMKNQEEINKEIYENVKKIKQKENRKKILIDFGDLPIFFMTILSSFCISFLLSYYIIFMDTNIKIPILLGDNTIAIIFSIITVYIFLVSFMIFQISIIIYKKKLELSINDNRK